MVCWNGSDAGRVGRLLALVGALAPAAAPGETPADPEVYMADPITVTATRNPLPAFEFPGMVSVIGRERLERQQASTPDDFLRWVPNVEFVGGPRRTGEVPSIRGFSGPDVVVTLDGARQNFDSAHDFYLAWAPSAGPLAGLRLDLGVDNAFDRAYSRVFTGALEPGRNLKAQLAYAVSF